MNPFPKILFFVPLAILLALSGLLGWELFHARPEQLPSALTGKKVPAFSLPSLAATQPVFTQKNLTSHQAVLLNVWATWCEACLLEHPMLMKISQQYRVPIYSILYKDDPQKALHWLEENGNPYVRTGNDNKGNTAIDLGVYGTPETFVISPQGSIVYRHTGLINQETWDKILSPLIGQYGA